MDRYTCIRKIVDGIKLIDGGTSPFNNDYSFNVNVYENVFDYCKYIEDIDAFPTVSVHCTNERIIHSLSDERYSMCTIEIRGYMLDENVEESGEALASDIEHVLQYVDIADLKIMSIETDGGLQSPMGVCIITVGGFFKRWN
jgi:hypothetical protein